MIVQNVTYGWQAEGHSQQVALDRLLSQSSAFWR